MQSSLCSNCGHSLQIASNYCNKCGMEVAKSMQCLIQVPRVVILTLLSGGLYIFWWFYITWKHYRDHTGEKAYPVWHALATIVPFYNLFRVHAHIRTYSELMDKHHLPNSLNPFKAAVVFGISTFLANIGLRQAIFGEVSQNSAIVILGGLIVSMMLVLWLLASVQSNLNKYWQSVLFEKSPSYARIGIGEVLVTLAGIYNWYDFIMLALSESYRASW